MRKFILAVLFVALCIISGCTTDGGYWYELDFRIDNKSDVIMTILDTNTGYEELVPSGNSWTYYGHTSVKMITEKPLTEKEVKKKFEESAIDVLNDAKTKITVKIGDKTLSNTLFSPEYWIFAYEGDSYCFASYTLALDEDMIKKIGYAE